MIDTKCVVVNKVHRGQDFQRLYCDKCPHRNLAQIEVRANVNLVDGPGKEVKITCPNLKFYRSYVPLREKGNTERIGQSTSIIYAIAYKKLARR